MSASYSQGEVLWLLSMSREEAILCDAVPRDSCADLAADDGGHAPSADPSLPVIARWWDVRRARDRIRLSKEQEMAARLRAEGFTERELASVLGCSQPTAHRRVSVTLRELVRELGER